MKLSGFEMQLNLLVLLPFVVAGCSNDDDVSSQPPPEEPPVVLSVIDVSPSTVSYPLPVGVSYPFTATGTYSDGSREDLTSSAAWSSADTMVATVDANGLATGVAAGTTDISASMSDVTSNTVPLTVADLDLVSITVTPATVPNALPVGRTENFHAEGLFSNDKAYDITNYVVWNSSDVTKATITQTGEATAVDVGATDISASTMTPALSSNVVALTTANPAPDFVRIEPEVFPTLPIGRAQQLLAFLVYTDGTQYNITNTGVWTSGDTNIAKVRGDIGGEINGTVAGVDIGETQISITDNNTGLADTVPVSVVDEEITGVILKPGGPVDIPLTSTQAYSAEGTFSDGINRRLGDSRAWALSDTSIATLVSNDTDFVALVEGIATGSVAVIYHDVLANGSRTGVEGQSTLNVDPAVLKAISISPELDFSLPVNVVMSFEAIGDYTDGTRRLITSDVTWVSQSVDVAAFGPESGKLTALVVSAPGTDVLATQADISSGMTNVSVNDATLELITIGPTPLQAQVSVGETVQLTARGTYSNSTFFDIATEVNWTSSDSAVVTVSNITGEKGQITGVMTGFAEVTATDPRTFEEDTISVVVEP